VRSISRIETSQHQPTAPKRGRPRSLTDEQVVEAAVKLATTTRLEDVSMRALALELGVPVMTIYSYVPSKAALYELVIDSVLRPVRVPSESEGSWEVRLKLLERDARSALARFPGLSLDRKESTEGARLAEGVMSILASAGFTRGEAALAFATLFTFMVGQLDIDVDVAGAGGPAAMAVQSAAQITRRTPDDIFEFGFDAVIEGLKLKLGTRSPTSRKRPQR
jgi:AcrR family transcriptional regulator